MNLTIFYQGGIVMMPLSVLAIIALAIIIDKIIFLHKKCQLPKDIIKNLADFEIDTKKLFNQTKELSKQHYFYNFFKLIEDSKTQKLGNLESKIIYEAKKFEKDFTKNLWILETIITSAPLLGLLGTIFGMSASFKIIGENNLTNASGITAGVAESLIATAFGLIIALLALFTYNFFSKIQSQILDDMEIYGNKLLENLKNS